MLTRQESERKHKEMLIDDSQIEEDEVDRKKEMQASRQKEKELERAREEENSLKGSKISYFQKSSPKRRKEVKL